MIQNINFYIGDVVSDKSGKTYVVIGIVSRTPQRRPICYNYILLCITSNYCFIPKGVSEENIIKNYTKLDFKPLFSLSDDYLCHNGRCGINTQCDLCDYNCFKRHDNTILVGDTVYSKNSKQNFIIESVYCSLFDPADSVIRPALTYSNILDSWCLNSDLFNNIISKLLSISDNITEDDIILYARKQILEILYSGLKQSATLIDKEHFLLDPENFNRVARGGLCILDNDQISYICSSCIYKNCENCETNNIKRKIEYYGKKFERVD